MTAEEILALPEFGPSFREYKCQCGHSIRIPTFPAEKASFYAEDSVIMAIDSNFERWVAVETEVGWRRRRL